LAAVLTVLVDLSTGLVNVPTVLAAVLTVLVDLSTELVNVPTVLAAVLTVSVDLPTELVKMSIALMKLPTVLIEVLTIAVKVLTSMLKVSATLAGLPAVWHKHPFIMAQRPHMMAQMAVDGALIQMEGVRAKNDCSVEESRVEAIGGQVQKSKISLGEYGFCSICQDTEGNAFGLYSMQ